MGSTRLPGKSLAQVAGRSLIAHCVERLRAPYEMRVVVATTTRPEDDCVEREALRLGIEVVRGPDEDVLARYLLVATRLGLVDLVRATADNPAVDIDAPARVLEIRRRTGADHVVEFGLPYGSAVEAVSTAALVRAAALATDAADREHVTTFIRRDSRFLAISAIAPAAVRRPNLRLTVDTAEDLEWVRQVFNRAETVDGGAVPVPLRALIAAADHLMRATPPAAGAGERDVK
jgi:spore coat polysaccharide biosynthesis protein SpsF